MDNNSLDVDRRDADDTRFIHLAGELDLSNFALLLKALEGWENFDRIVVDTTELRFLDSSGLSALIAAHRTLGADRFRLIQGVATAKLLKLTSTADLLGAMDDLPAD